MANFNLSDYETVDSRIHKFYEKHPNGRIITDLVQTRINDVGQIIQYICKAEVYRDMADPVPSATGYAEEILGSNPVNRTSALENCETSAIGRCLANLAFSPKGSRPSQEEMTKAERTKSSAPSKTISEIVQEATSVKLEPKPTKAKLEGLKVDALSKAKFYKLEGHEAMEFLKEWNDVPDSEQIDWYAISLMSKKEWDTQVNKWRLRTS